MPRLSAARDLCKSAFGETEKQPAARICTARCSGALMQPRIPVNNNDRCLAVSGKRVAYGLGTKFIAFLYGPYRDRDIDSHASPFCSYFAMDRIVDARKRIVLLSVCRHHISIPLTVIIYLLTGPMVNVISKEGYSPFRISGSYRG